jgi:hypothetical protein
MEGSPTPENKSQPVFDVNTFANSYEAFFNQSSTEETQSKIQNAQEVIYGAIFHHYPDQAMELYTRLVVSENSDVRIDVVRGLPVLVTCYPEDGANLWLQLLNDPDRVVALAAYVELEKYGDSAAQNGVVDNYDSVISLLSTDSHRKAA